MANQIDGGTQGKGVVSGLDQEELTLKEKMAKKASVQGASNEALNGSEPGKTPVSTGEADDAFGSPASA